MYGVSVLLGSNSIVIVPSLPPKQLTSVGIALNITGMGSSNVAFKVIGQAVEVSVIVISYWPALKPVNRPLG